MNDSDLSNNLMLAAGSRTHRHSLCVLNTRLQMGSSCSQICFVLLPSKLCGYFSPSEILDLMVHGGLFL